MLTGFYERIVIADTSCFIAFDNIDHFDILQTLCPFIITTPEVISEFKKPFPEWIKIVEVKDTVKIKSISTLLGIGEASAIALALETENSLLIIDDKKARRYAQNLGLNFTGIIGLLRLGFKQGLIPEIDSIITDLRAIGFRLPANTEDLIKK